jgi:hypothetical protein
MGLPGFSAEAALPQKDGLREQESVDGAGHKERAAYESGVAPGAGPTHRLGLPGFISEDIGLGDVVKRVTSAVGIQPCGGCQRRAQALNNWLVFSAPRRR